VATEIMCKVVTGGLQCLGMAEASKLEDLHGREVMATIKQARNPKFHRLYFAMLKASIDMAHTDYTMEQWRAIVTVGAGHCDFVEHDEKMIAIPNSISFGKMDETQFDKLYNDSVTFICSHYLHGTEPDELDREARFVAFL
jgi:hypothetical protein